MKSKITHAFAVLAMFINSIIRWKKPVYTLTPLHERVRIALLIFLALFVFDWNFSNLTFVRSKLSDNLRFIGYGLRLDQSWGMFAPGVFKDDGWYILEGTTVANETFDLLNQGKKIGYRKPKSVTAMFKNDRWRKYSENYIFEDNLFMRGYFCNYYKRIWNEKHPNRQIKSLKVVYMGELTLPAYRYSAPQKNVLWECIE